MLSRCFLITLAPKERRGYAIEMMKSLASITLIGRDRTGVVARVTDFLFRNSANIEEIEQQVTRGQRLEARTLVRAVQLCLRKRLDIHRGVVHNV